uniref:Uncharacterized protein n=1 Tax=Oryza meridionalis TaxID=40149 RepID=A0A0E0CIB7_9ORYZ
MALVGGGGKVVTAAAAGEPGVARRLWRVVRAVLYMLRRGLAPSGRKLAMDLHLLLRRGKIAGKALGHLVTFHHHHHNHGHGFSASAAAAGSSSLSCRGIDPALAVYEPSRGRRREVEFSCSNTPSSTTGGGGGGGGLLGRRRRNRHHRRDEHEYSYSYSNDAGGSGYYDHGYDAAYVARVFEMLNDSEHLFNDDDDAAVAPATAETTPLWTPARSHHSHSPAPAAPSRHRGRITDSPFAASNGDEAGGGAQQQVDRKADEFIRRFYEQLRAQRNVAATPDYYGASPYAGRRAPRPVAAGIA